MNQTNRLNKKDKILLRGQICEVGNVSLCRSRKLFGNSSNDWDIINITGITLTNRTKVNDIMTRREALKLVLHPYVVKLIEGYQKEIVDLKKLAGISDVISEPDIPVVQDKPRGIEVKHVNFC